MRIKKEILNIDYSRTKAFFKKRAGKFMQDNPYSVTMYQDSNKRLVEERNRKEVEKLFPLLNIQKNTRLLDIACGIGRWADAIQEEIDEYCGVDFSGELVSIAVERNSRSNFFFYEGAANEIEKVLQINGKGKFNTFLVVGILMYLNDSDMNSLLEQIESISEEHALICIREPIGIRERLTLKDFYSEELEDNYNAIYRTREELECSFSGKLYGMGYKVYEHGFLFDEDTSLNNRKETAQYYYILKR